VEAGREGARAAASEHEVQGRGNTDEKTGEEETKGGREHPDDAVSRQGRRGEGDVLIFASLRQDKGGERCTYEHLINKKRPHGTLIGGKKGRKLSVPPIHTSRVRKKKDRKRTTQGEKPRPREQVAQREGKGGRSR